MSAARIGVVPAQLSGAYPTGVIGYFHIDTLLIYLQADTSLALVVRCRAARSQGGVKFPTGGMFAKTSPRAPGQWPGSSRSGATPEPTVIVRMKESGFDLGALMRPVCPVLPWVNREEERTIAVIQLDMKSGAIMGPVYFVTAGALFAGANTAVQGAGMLHGVPSPTIAFWQYSIALLAILPLVWRASWRTDRPVLHVIRVGLAAIGVQLWVAGLAVVPIWQAIALILTSPLFVTLGAGVFLGEPLTRTRVLAVLAGGAGGVLVLAPWQDAFSWAAVLPLGAATFWGGSSLVAKRLTKTESAGTLTLYLLVLLLPINAIGLLGAGVRVAPEALWLVALSGLLIAAAQFLLVRAYVVADAAYLQPFDHLKLPLNVGLGLLFFGFAPPGLMWLGAGVIVVASGWIMREEA